VLTLGRTSTVKVSGQVEKQGVLTISAQSNGVVSHISIHEGEEVKKQKNLLSLSSNYQGGNAASVSRQLAAKQYENARDTLNTQKEVISKQKEVAEQTATQTEELRKIAVTANDETKSLLSLNQDILDTINNNLEDLESNNTGGVNDQLILQTQQAKAILQQGINTLQNAIRTADFNTNTNNPSTKLANLNKEITLKQLEIQEKGLVLASEVARLQLSLAAVNEAMMFPVSPCNGVIQKIHLVKGELVSPGNPLVTISCKQRSVEVVAKLPSQIAKQASMLTESLIFINGERVHLLPNFISTEATDGQLYQIVYQIPEEFQEHLTDSSFLNIELPVGDMKSATQFFVPLDSVFQTQEETFVYIIQGEVAASKKITLGEVLGSDVEVLEGLDPSDKVILNRNVIAGDKVRVIDE
jgi:membrane fusion protein